MDWQKRMNRAMDRIEAQLGGQVDYAEAARQMCCSPAQLRRMFSFVAHMPLTEYVRRRRLTLAAEDIRRGDRLIDVALRYGYESQAAFSRAFRRMHGCSPSAARDENAPLRPCPRLHFKLVLMEGSYMEKQQGQRANIIGAGEAEPAVSAPPEQSSIHRTNDSFWQEVGGQALGCITLPKYGAFTSEESCRLLGDLAGKTVLELACGDGQSLLYLHKNGAGELWGVDLSEAQLGRARAVLGENGVEAALIRTPMERCEGLPEGHFDLVVSVYGIGWAADLGATFRRVRELLKPGGAFVFSWSHPIHKCVAAEGGELVFKKSYFDESWYAVNVGGSTLNLADRKLSTYLNTLIEAGFAVEKLVEQTDESLLDGSDFAKKARLLPVTFVVRARRLF